jgi:hypothetical protein
VLYCVCVEDLLLLWFLMYGKDLLLSLFIYLWNEVLVKLGCIVNLCFDYKLIFEYMSLFF